MATTFYRLKIDETPSGLVLNSVERSLDNESFVKCTVEDVGDPLDYLSLEESDGILLIAPSHVKTYADLNAHCGKSWEWGKTASGLLEQVLEGLYLVTWSGRVSTPTNPKYAFEGIGGSYATHWGISDFSDRHEAAFRSALSSGEPFTTGEFGSKKEILWATVLFDGSAFYLEVRAKMDETRSLIDTAIWDALGKNNFAGSGWDAIEKKYGLSEDLIDKLFEKIESYSCDPFGENLAPTNSEEGNSSTSYGELPVGSTFEQICDKLDELASKSRKELKDQYESLVQYMKDGLDEYVQEVLDESR